MKPQISQTCQQCGTSFERPTIRKFCSLQCAGIAKRGVPNPKVAAYARANNAMKDPVARAKMTATLRRIGHKPTIRGGNGSGMTEPQRVLLEALQHLDMGEWIAEFVVNTAPRQKGTPNHYKIDLACPSRMLAVEVDGPSHGTIERRAADARKDAFLTSRGWMMFRFTNATCLEVPDITAECILGVLDGPERDAEFARADHEADMAQPW